MGALLGKPPDIPQMPWPRGLLVGMRHQISACLSGEAVMVALVMLFLFQGLRIVLRRQWLAIAVLLALLRFGLLASVFFLYFLMILTIPPMLGLGGWHSGGAWMVLSWAAILTGFGCYTAMAGRPLFRDELLEAG